MTLRFLALAALISIFSTNYSMQKVTLVDAATLQTHLEQIDMTDLVMHTDIIARLAGKTFLPVRVELELAKCLHTYAEYIQKTNPTQAHMFAVVMEASRSLILEALLEGSTPAPKEADKNSTSL